MALGEPSLNGLAILYRAKGSKMDEDTGAGVYYPYPMIKHLYKLKNNCSGFQAEILAVKRTAGMVRTGQ